MAKLTPEELEARKAAAEKKRQQREDDRAMRATEKLNATREKARVALAKALKKDQEDEASRVEKIASDKKKAAEKLARDEESFYDKAAKDYAKEDARKLREQRKRQTEEETFYKKAAREYAKQDRDREVAAVRTARATAAAGKAAIRQQKSEASLGAQLLKQNLARTKAAYNAQWGPKQLSTGMRGQKVAGFKPGAGASLMQMMHNQGLPPLPIFPPSPAEPAPDFVVPQSKQGFLNRITGGRLFQPRAPQSGPNPPSLMRRGLDAADSGVDRMIGVRDEVQKAQKGDMLDKLSMALKGQPGTVALAGAASAATAAIGGLGGIIGFLKDTFMATWTYIDTKVLPTTSMLNRAIGVATPGMGALRNEAMKTGLQFERLGLGFEHGAQTVKELAVNLKTANIPADLADTLVKISEYAGVGAENTGKLARSFLATGATTKGLGRTLDKVMSDAGNAAHEFAVPMNLVRKDFGDSADLAQRWGTQNSTAFVRAIAYAQSYGLSIRELEGTFGKSMDTFETTSDIASKLNAAFGTNLDSVKLLGMDSKQRMETIRNAMLSVNKSWDSMLPKAKNVLMQTLGIKDEAEGASIFGSQKQRDQAMAQVELEKKATAGMQEWKNALGSLGTQLTSIEQLTRNFLMAVGNVVAKLLGFDSGIDASKEGVKVFEGFVDNLTGKINEFAASLPDNKNGAGAGFIAFVKDMSQTVHDFTGAIYDALDMFDSAKHLGLTGNAFDYGKQFASLKAANDTVGLEKLQATMSGDLRMDPDGPIYQLMTHAAARRAHIQDSDVQSTFTAAAQTNTQNRQNTLALMRGETPAMDFSGDPGTTPIVIQLMVDGSQLAEATVDTMSGMVIQKGVKGR